MFEWKIQANIEECSGLILNPRSQYTMLMKLDNEFSTPSDAAKILSNRLRFHTQISLSFVTDTFELPSSNVLQLLMIESENSANTLTKNTKKQDIIGIATIKIKYPLPQELTSFKIYKFDRSYESKATIRIALDIRRQEAVKKKPLTHHSQCHEQKPIIEKVTHKDDGLLQELLKLQLQKTKECFSYLQFINKSLDSTVIEVNRVQTSEKIEAVVQERNELYKMSQDLYQQLKKCMSERDQYLRQLRERELSEEQIREQLQFLKLKLQQEGPHSHIYQAEIEELKVQNSFLAHSLDEKDIQVRELERKVKECLIAIEEFKHQALEARSELINKQSQYSQMSRHNKYLDPYECIQELYRQLEERRTEKPFTHEIPRTSKKEFDQIVVVVRRELSNFFLRLLKRLTLSKEKQWLLREKADFEKKIEQIILIEEEMK